MKKLAYVAGLFALTCAPLLAALYEGLEVGMDKDQVLKTLRRSKQLEGPPTDALLARTGLNGVFKTRQAIGGQTFALNFDYDPSGGLKAVVFYSRSKHRGSEYETKLKSAYKALLVGLTEQFGEPVNMPEWVARESLQVQKGQGGTEKGMGGHPGISRFEGGGTPHFRRCARHGFQKV